MSHRERPRPHILLSGRPGVGKTTLIQKLCLRLPGMSPVGFFTREIREQGVRQGFELVSLDGRTAVLSHVSLGGPYRVGRYGVDVDGFDAFLDTVCWEAPGSLAVIDEIGRMECFSRAFHELVLRLLESEKRLVATVASRGGGLIAEVKERSDCRLLEMTTANRDRLLEEILRLVSG